MKKALRFAIVVCLVSWAASGIFYAACKGDIAGHKMAFTAFCTGYMLLPMLTAMVMQKLDKEPFSSTGLLNFKPRWSWLTAVVLPPVLVVLATFLSTLFPGVSLKYNPEQVISIFSVDDVTAASMREQFLKIPAGVMILVTLVSGAVAGCTINALLAFGEEYGWRNYMVSAMNGKSFFTAALTTGVVWGIWHAPIILMGHNYPQHPVAGVFMMTVFCLLLGFMELYMVKKTGSVVPAAIFHGSINAVCGASLYFVEGGNDLTVGCTGTAGFIAMAIICLGIVIYDRTVSKDRIIV